jgi:DNA-binding transcriptional ArsR family regulator
MIRDRQQILALASPVRLALVETLAASGPSSVAALAAMVGAKPDALYYHLRILESRGLVRRTGHLESQAVYEVTATPLRLAYVPANARNRDAVARVVAAILRGALRAFRSAFQRRPRVSGKWRELWAAQETARLTRDELATVNRLAAEILQTFERAKGERRGERLYSFTFVLSPQEK